VDNTRDYARVSHSRQWSNYTYHYYYQINHNGTNNRRVKV